jgi:hypothetical protein
MHDWRKTLHNSRPVWSTYIILVKFFRIHVISKFTHEVRLIFYSTPFQIWITCYCNVLYLYEDNVICGRWELNSSRSSIASTPTPKPNQPPVHWTNGGWFPWGVMLTTHPPPHLAPWLRMVLYFHSPICGQTIKFANSLQWNCYIPHYWISLWSPSKYSSWEATCQFRRLVQPPKQFWNWFCGMAFRAAVTLLLMSSNCLPFNIFFIFGYRKSLGAKSGEQGIPAQFLVIYCQTSTSSWNNAQ